MWSADLHPTCYSQNHQLQKCLTYNSYTLASSISYVALLHRCHNCLELDHTADLCDLHSRCQHCKALHHYSLCPWSVSVSNRSSNLMKIRNKNRISKLPNGSGRMPLTVRPAGLLNKQAPSARTLDVPDRPTPLHTQFGSWGLLSKEC